MKWWATGPSRQRSSRPHTDVHGRQVERPPPAPVSGADALAGMLSALGGQRQGDGQAPQPCGGRGMRRSLSAGALPVEAGNSSNYCPQHAGQPLQVEIGTGYKRSNADDASVKELSVWMQLWTLKSD